MVLMLLQDTTIFFIRLLSLFCAVTTFLFRLPIAHLSEKKSRIILAVRFRLLLHQLILGFVRCRENGPDVHTLSSVVTLGITIDLASCTGKQ